MSIQTVSQYIQYCTSLIEQKWKPQIRDARSAAGGEFPRDGIEGLKAERAWFRGQSVDEPLLPKVFRKRRDAEETRLVLDFRRRARGVVTIAPNLYEYDEWLFLMQHHRLPTRLLDWTESLLVGLFFAVNEHGLYKRFCRMNKFNPVVWMMNPHVLNWMFSGSSILLPTGRDEVGESGSGENPSQEGLCNIKGAFTRNRVGIDSPVAIVPKLIDRRMHAQRSCFTVHGKDHRSLEEIFQRTDLVEREYLTKIRIHKDKAEDIVQELRRFGISESVLFPDLEGLSRDLTAEFSWTLG